MTADIVLSFRYDAKDNKWRWLAEVEGGHVQAGEERHYSKAVQLASLAAEGLVRRP